MVSTNKFEPGITGITDLGDLSQSDSLTKEEVENYNSKHVFDLEQAWDKISDVILNTVEKAGNDKKALLMRIQGMIDHLNYKEDNK